MSKSDYTLEDARNGFHSLSNFVHEIRAELKGLISENQLDIKKLYYFRDSYADTLESLQQRSEKKELDRLNTSIIDHPEHYQSANGIECIDAIEALEMNFNLGNALKYIWRCEQKGNKREDLDKAVWYLQREIKRCQTFNFSFKVDSLDLTKLQEAGEIKADVAQIVVSDLDGERLIEENKPSDEEIVETTKESMDD